MGVDISFCFGFGMVVSREDLPENTFEYLIEVDSELIRPMDMDGDRYFIGIMIDHSCSMRYDVPDLEASADPKDFARYRNKIHMGLHELASKETVLHPLYTLACRATLKPWAYTEYS